MRFPLAAFALILVAGGAHGQQLPTVSQLLAAESEATQGCEGTGDPAAIRDHCVRRDRLSGRLAQAGYCWGRKGQTDAKRAWHPCGPDSLTVDDVEAVRR
jgi:hypothetical protein